MIDSKLVDKFESNVDYTTVLDNFEGPLDLLLFLIKKEQIEIKDVFVSKVTEQFLAYMKGLDYLDIDKASEYLVIAATIIEMKSRSLVPSREIDEEDDPGAQLILNLEELDMIRKAGAKLKEQEDVGKFYKQPDKNVGEVKIVYRDFNLDGLIKAFEEMLLRVDRKAVSENLEKEIPKDVFTVSDKIVFIRNIVSENENVRFSELFTEHSTKSEIVTTFQALLELLKLHIIHVNQGEIYSDITITMNKEEAGEQIGELSEYN